MGPRRTGWSLVFEGCRREIADERRVGQALRERDASHIVACGLVIEDAADAERGAVERVPDRLPLEDGDREVRLSTPPAARVPGEVENVAHRVTLGVPAQRRSPSGHLRD